MMSQLSVDLKDSFLRIKNLKCYHGASKNEICDSGLFIKKKEVEN